MFLPFLRILREEGVPTGPGEFLTFLAALSEGIVTFDTEGFYHLARAALVKDERHLDRFDRAFSRAFSGLETIPPEAVLAALDLPEDWLRKGAGRHLSAEERERIEALGGFEALMETLRQRLAEQKRRHEGGSKWIGTGSTSPFGAHGYNPEGIRIGQDESRHLRAVKVWDRREFRNLDDRVEIGTRNIKMALRALRRWARDGAAEELDLDHTIRATAHQGWLDVKTRPERRNGAKVLLFLDVGGSMDPHVRVMEELFSAARSEFRHLEVHYFHNCLYESVWRDNRRRYGDRTPTWDLLRGHGPDWRAIFVGDAAMSPYEISHPGGAVEHWNPEPGALWLSRATGQWPHHLWINPVAEAEWRWTPSTAMIQAAFGGRMVPMTPEGIARGVRDLR
ncbi:vWA domain-containing protein [Pseudogemmobacter sonorensis]|uniref:vWA domain-containing protein n=1 Tax=Pseudogemmobacter sonorensis TaxID=2989681 RepID=UPI003693CF55